MNGQGAAVSAGNNPTYEAFRQAPLQKIGRATVQPVRVQIKVARDAISCFTERCWQWVSGTELAALGDGDKINISRSPADQAKSCQGRAAYDDDLLRCVSCLQLLSECPEDGVEGLGSDVHALS